MYIFIMLGVLSSHTSTTLVEYRMNPVLMVATLYIFIIVNLERCFLNCAKPVYCIDCAMLYTAISLCDIGGRLRDMGEGLRNTREGLCDIGGGLRDIEEGLRDTGEGLCDIRESLCDIEESLCDIEEGLCDVGKSLHNIEKSPC
jgi:hypothetical protein